MKEAASTAKMRLDRPGRDEGEDMAEKRLEEWPGCSKQDSQISGNSWNGMENCYVID